MLLSNYDVAPGNALLFFVNDASFSINNTPRACGREARRKKKGEKWQEKISRAGSERKSARSMISGRLVSRVARVRRRMALNVA